MLKAGVPPVNVSALKEELDEKGYSRLLQEKCESFMRDRSIFDAVSSTDANPSEGRFGHDDIEILRIIELLGTLAFLRKDTFYMRKFLTRCLNSSTVDVRKALQLELRNYIVEIAKKKGVKISDDVFSEIIKEDSDKKGKGARSEYSLGLVDINNIEPILFLNSVYFSVHAILSSNKRKVIDKALSCKIQGWMDIKFTELGSNIAIYHFFIDGIKIAMNVLMYVNKNPNVRSGGYYNGVDENDVGISGVLCIIIAGICGLLPSLLIAFAMFMLNITNPVIFAIEIPVVFACGVLISGGILFSINRSLEESAIHAASYVNNSRHFDRSGHNLQNKCVSPTQHQGGYFEPSSSTKKND